MCPPHCVSLALRPFWLADVRPTFNVTMLAGLIGRFGVWAVTNE